MKNYVIFLFVLLILSSITSADTTQQHLQSIKTGDNSYLIQNCVNSTYANLTRITVNQNIIFSGEISMTKIGDNYNYTYSNNSVAGAYYIYGSCDENGLQTNWAYDYSVSPTGTVMSSADSLIYILIISILSISMIVGVFYMFRPGMSTSFKVSLFNILYILFICTAFLTWKVATDFLYNTPVLGSILYYVWLIPFVLLAIEILVSAGILITAGLNASKDKKMLAMGYSQEDIDRKKRK